MVETTDTYTCVADVLWLRLPIHIPVLQMCCSQTAGGLCGTCSNCPAFNTPLPCGLGWSPPDEPSPPPPPSLWVDENDDQNSITEKMQKLRVPEDEDLSGSVLQEGTGPGKMLQFDDSSAITDSLDDIGKLCH